MVWELLYYTADEANVYRELINYYRGQCIAQRVSDIISSRWFNAWHEGSDEMVPRDNKPSTKGLWLPKLTLTGSPEQWVTFFSTLDSISPSYLTVFFRHRETDFSNI